MTPLEKARQREAAGGIDYCDECEAFVVIHGTAYCERSGKLIHPIMLERGQGTGPAQNCKDRFIGDKKRRTNDPLTEWRGNPMDENNMTCPYCGAKMDKEVSS